MKTSVKKFGLAVGP